jgi:hypothetical protein
LRSPGQTNAWTDVGDFGGSSGGPATRSLKNVPSSELPPGTRVGEYVIQELVGKGGMGTVFSAVHPILDRKAAVKVIARELCTDPAFVERFVDEARAVNLIRHPNIVESFSIGQLDDGRRYYVMEWLEGQSLRDRMKYGPMSLAEALDVLDQAADALAAVHEKAIIHRDLTPRNLFLVVERGRQTLKIFDFGLAKRMVLGETSQLTNSGAMVGTPAYASPEQVCGAATDHRTDIYALGVIAFEMILGRRPFDDRQPQVVVARKLNEPAPSARSLWPDIPPEIDWLLSAMLDRDPARRPELAQIRALLAEVASRTLDLSRSSFSPAVVAPPRRRGRALVGAVVAVVAAAGAFAVTGLVTARDEQTAVAEPAPVVATATVDAATSPIAEPPEVGAIEVVVDAEGARIELDGQLISTSARRVRIPVEREGQHQLVVTAPGRERYERTIHVAARAVAAVDVRMASADKAARGKSTRTRGKASRKRSPTSDPEDFLIEPGRATSSNQ